MPPRHREHYSGIYKIEDIDGKFYIGSSCDLMRRWKYHLSLLNMGRHTNSRLQASYDKGFLFCHVLELCDPSLLIEREQFYIDTLHPSLNLVRQVGSGFMRGRKMSEETKKKIGQSNKKQWTPEKREWFTRKNLGNKYGLGTHRSDETKKKISMSHLGKTQPPHSQETTQKMSLAHKQRYLEHPEQFKKSDATRINIAKSFRKSSLTISNPFGVTWFGVYDLTGFCNLHELSYRAMRRILSGTYKGTYKNASLSGWKVMYAEK